MDWTQDGIEDNIYNLVQKKAALDDITHNGKDPFNNLLHWYKINEQKVRKAIHVDERNLLRVVAFQEKIH